MLNEKLIICLMGPTASGKTQLAVDLVKQFPLEIISVDSALVYKGMDIGTAKPDANVLREAPHHLIDLKDPAEAYSAAEFRRDALGKISEIISRGNTPLLVGGTMLYFKVLQIGLSDLPSAQEGIRKQILEKATLQGWPAMHEELRKVDPQAAERIHQHDTQRIQRALEVYEATGKNLTSWQQQQKSQLPYELLNIAIAPTDRALLHARIEERFKQMLSQGLVAEVEKLYDRDDLSRDTPSMRSVGYRQVWEYLENKCSYDDMVHKGIVATRQFAKRQLTWLRHWPLPVEWFATEDPELNSKVTTLLATKLSLHQ